MKRKIKKYILTLIISTIVTKLVNYLLDENL